MAKNDSGGEAVRVNMVAKINAMTADLPTVIASGDEAAVKVVRARIEMVRKAIFEATNTFDALLRNAQSGFNGADFLASVETFRKVSDKVGRPRSVKPAIPEEVTTW